MLQLVLTHEIYEEAILISSGTGTTDVQQDEEGISVLPAPSDASDVNQVHTDDNDDVKRLPVDALFYFQDWSQISDISTVWEGSFLSRRVRVTNLHLCFESQICFLKHKCNDQHHFVLDAKLILLVCIFVFFLFEFPYF